MSSSSSFDLWCYVTESVGLPGLCCVLQCFLAHVGVSADSAAESWGSRRSRSVTAPYYLQVF